MLKSSPDDRRAAYVREAPYRPSWPKTFAEADADPIISRILDILARKVPALTRKRADRGLVGIDAVSTLRKLAEPQDRPI